MSKRDRENGAAAVEFALLLPILLALVFGIVEFGRAYHIQSTLSGAAREGVRVMALTNNLADTTTAVTTYSPTLNASDLTVAATPCPSTGGGNTRVTVTYTFSSLTGWIPMGPTMTGTGTMRCNG